MAGEHRTQANGSAYRTAKARFVRNAEPICGVCGKDVDKTLAWPHPGSPSVDHVVPLARGGKAMDQSLWQLAHLGCNRWKSDKVVSTFVDSDRVHPSDQPTQTVATDPCAGVIHNSRIHYDGQELTPCPVGHGYHAATRHATIL